VVSPVAGRVQLHLDDLLSKDGFCDGIVSDVHTPGQFVPAVGNDDQVGRIEFAVSSCFGL
jgi:hypothetical protein